MAIGIGGKERKSEDTGYLSDESDFYGDETVKQEYEAQALAFDPAEYLKHKIPSLTEIANTNLKNAKVVKAATLYNPYEGSLSGRQLGESVDEFLERLPPATTSVTEIIPWIYIANPYRKALKRDGHDQKESDEAPPDEESDWAQFVVRGGNLLKELTTTRHTIEKEKVGKPKMAITRAVNLEKDKIVKKLLDTAVELHCTSGKWMIFCPASEVNAVWAVVARATANNELGIAAKVSPDDGGDRKDRVICTYTKDFTDMKDVSRVVHKLKDLGVVDSRAKPIYYKCDAYTYLHLGSGNEYNIKASLYSSAEILKSKPGKATDAKIDGFFSKQ
ncbi:DUF1917-domain-containing protein [Stipitochalara longipes BDJ]|nr:DUF1917-domain-containing protein [Stipitochalara longipes BDJ]